MFVTRLHRLILCFFLSVVCLVIQVVGGNDHGAEVGGGVMHKRAALTKAQSEGGHAHHRPHHGGGHHGGGHHGGGGLRNHTTKRCGGINHGSLTRPCSFDDSYCGDWDLRARQFFPLGCHYEEITSEMARKCVGNKTLAFIGDSQVRDLAIGLAFLLSGVTALESPTEKFDYKHSLDTNGTKIEDFSFWQHNVPGHNFNGYVFPQAHKAAAEGWSWQVQVWNLFRNEFIQSGQVDDVLSNKKLLDANPLLRPIDLAFWNHGLHDWGWWDKEPYGEKFFDTMVTQWLEARKKTTIPIVWVSMNDECAPKISFSLNNRAAKQAEMVKKGNLYTNSRLQKEGLPYWDANAVLRTPVLCNISDDGVHVKMFVDLVRAKMLIHHLCDHNMIWHHARSPLEYFI